MRIAVLVPSLLVCAAATLSAASADERDALPGQLRLMFTHNPVYEVEETQSGSGGSTDYEWKDEDPGAIGVGLQYLAPFGRSVAERPLLWGIEVQYQSAKVEPDGYTSNGLSFTNNDHETFNYSAITVGGVFAWRFSQPEDRGIGFLAELQLMLGATVLSGDITSDTGSSDGGLGYGLDGCARVLFGLQEANWLGAVSFGLRSGFASIDLDQGGVTSDLDLDRTGVEIGLIIGHDL